MKAINKTRTLSIFVAIGCAINFLLFLIKLYVGLSVNSISIYADSLNNLLDAFTCLIAVIGFKIILSKPDEHYPFGKGRAEDIVSTAIALAVTLTGAYFFYISLERMMYPAPVWFSSKYAYIIVGTLLVKLALALFFRKGAKKHGSDILASLKIDSFLDFFITLCTLLSFTLSETLSFSVDGAAGIIIGILLTAQGVKSTAKAISCLLGKRDSELCEKVISIAAELCKDALVTDVQCHKYGDLNIFCVSINADKNYTEIIHETEKLTQAVKEQMNAEIYYKFGGNNEN